MSDIIKFRQYIPALEGSYHYWGYGDINEDGSFFTGPIVMKDSIQEQFTGIYDCNGREIYNGDILLSLAEDGVPYWYDKQLKAHLCGDCGIGQVEWLDEICGWYVGGEIQNGLGELNGYRTIEVISNIHLNPELCR
jgi:hypothetical protein